METKEEKFRRMLAIRLPNAVKAVELLAKLSRKQDYAYAPVDVQKMLDQLDDAVDMVAKSFGAMTKGEELSPEVIEIVGRAPNELIAELPMKVVAPDRLLCYPLVSEALKHGDEATARAMLEAIIDRWLHKEA